MSDQEKTISSADPQSGTGTPDSAEKWDTSISATRPSRAVLAILALSQFMVTVDVTIVTVAYPHIQRTLDIPSGQLQWITVAYTLTFGGFLVLAGRAGDIFGKRRLWLIGLALFTLASLACAVASSQWEILVARGVQGLGAAFVVPSALALLNSTFEEGPARNNAIAIWSAIAAAGALTGYTLGGLITGLVGWRWVFLINLPIGLFCLYRGRRLRQPPTSARRPRLDVAGAASLTSGLILTLFATSQLTSGDSSPFVVATLVAGAGLLVVFVLAERRAVEPLIRFGIFSNHSVLGGNLVNLFSPAASAVIVFITTLYLQKVLGLSPFLTGLSFAPITLIGAFVARQTGPLMNRVGARRLLLSGTAVAALGALWLSRAPVHGTYWLSVLPGILMTNLGSMASFAPSMVAATSGIDASEQGLATGLVSTAQQLGGALGLALLGALAASVAAGSSRADLLAGYHAAYLGAGLLWIGSLLVAFLFIRLGRPKAR